MNGIFSVYEKIDNLVKDITNLPCMKKFADCLLQYKDDPHFDSIVHVSSIYITLLFFAMEDKNDT